MNTHINKNHRNRKIVKYDRQFLGTVVSQENYREILEKEGRDGLNYHNKHLRAYKQGKTQFSHGIRVNEKGEYLGIAWHPVKAELTVL